MPYHSLFSPSHYFVPKNIAVNAVLTAYGLLSTEAKAELEAEKTLLDSLLAKIGELEENDDTSIGNGCFNTGASCKAFCYPMTAY